MKTLLTIVAVLALAGVATAQTATFCYNWDDGSTALGEYGLVEYFNVPNTAGAPGSGNVLAIRETGSGTGQIYAAWVCGLQEGDEITASFDVWDTSAGSAYTSTRIWGHYTFTTGIEDYDGSASGNLTYSDGLGWDNLEWTWTIPALKECLVVEIRPYGGGDYNQEANLVDNLCVTVPSGRHIWFPDGTVDNTDDNATWGTVKAMYK